MAISKKSLGKVLAISMASAMAMSSLSAALVSVSAVSPAALANSGTVSLNDSTTDDITVNGTVYNDVEEALQAAIKADNDNRADLLGGTSFSLSNLTDIITNNAQAIKYTDSDGQEAYVTDIEVSYGLSGSGAQFDVRKNPTEIQAKDASGSATLTMTMKGKVELGGGKSDKSVTLKHSIDLDIRKAGEYGLVAYANSAADNAVTPLSKTDRNDLAAYGENLYVKLVQYGEGVGGSDDFTPSKNVVTVDLKSGDEVVTDGTTLKNVLQKTISAFEAAYTGDAAAKEKIVTQLTAVMNDAEKGAVITKEADKATGATDTDLATNMKGIFESAAWCGADSFVDIGTNDVYGFDLTLKTATGVEIYADDADTLTTDRENWINKEANADPKNSADKFVPVTATMANGTTTKTFYATSASDLTGFASDVATKIGANQSAGTYFKEVTDMTQFKDGASADTWTMTGTTLGVGETSNNPQDAYSGTIYELVDSAELKYADATAMKADLDKAIAAIADCKIAEDKDSNYFWEFKAAASDNTATAEEAAQADAAMKAYLDANVALKKFFDTATPFAVGDYESEIAGVADGGNEEALVALANAYNAAIDSFAGGSGAGVDRVRFYAGTGDDLFKVTNVSGADVEKDWEKSSSTNDKKGVAIEGGSQATIVLSTTEGKTGNGTIKVAIPREEGAAQNKELSLDVRVVRAADFDAGTITIERTGSKTVAKIGDATSTVTSDKNINGFEIRTTGGVTVESGTVGKIDAGSVTVNGGRTGEIDVTGAVQVNEDGIVGDITGAASVIVQDGGQAGRITDGSVNLKEGIIASIDTNADVTLEGGTVTGDVRSSGAITITSDTEDTNNNALDMVIGGNVIGSGDDATIFINNESEDGEAEISIGGYVLSRFVDISDRDETVTVGNALTTGPIKINGAVQGQRIVLGGNGLVALNGVRAATEVEHTDDDGELVESRLAFEGFNSTIESIRGFADVEVREGTVNVKDEVSATNLTVNSDAQIIASSMTIEEDIMESGSIVVPAGKLTVTGSVDDVPSLALLGEVSQGTLAFIGNRGMIDAFETGGITLKAERQSNGNYNYTVDKVELNGLTAVGKDVALGVGQSKTVSVALDGALPEGATVEWSVDDTDIAMVTGNGTSATITGVDADDTTVTAKIVDANGRELGYEDASFEVKVLNNMTVDSIGGDIGPDDNQVDLDTKKKNMEAGQVYTFMVRGNNDVENISVTSGDTNVATVALANGTDSRGALYNITAVADGKTDITVTYQGKTSKIAVKVGGFQLDTSSKKMAPGQVYSVLAKNVPADQASNVTLAYDSNIVDVVKVNDNYNGRGVLFNVTAKAIGETEVKLTHNGETETMAVNVVENTGRLTLDTASYTMPFGGSYTIGVKVEKNGRQLSGEEVRAMISSGELVVTDSRTGSIVTTEVQANGNVRVTGRQNEGTTYVQFIVMQNGQRVTHASVGVTVQNGATAGGSSVRSISQW